MHSNSLIACRRICSWKMSFTFLLRASLFTIYGAHIPYMMLQYLKLHLNRWCCYNFFIFYLCTASKFFLKPSGYSFLVLLKFNVLLICFIITNFLSSMHNASVKYYQVICFIAFNFLFHNSDEIMKWYQLNLIEKYSLQIVHIRFDRC